MEKYFTLQEANRLLPAVNRELENLQSYKQKIDHKYRQLQKIKGDPAIHADEEFLFSMEAELDFLIFQAQMHMDNIHNTGAQLKDIDMGLIDFPSWKDGEVILLCWKQGEEMISHWHGLQEGFLGRKKIENT